MCITCSTSEPALTGIKFISESRNPCYRRCVVEREGGCPEEVFHEETQRGPGARAGPAGGQVWTRAHVVSEGRQADLARAPEKAVWW